MRAFVLHDFVCLDANSERGVWDCISGVNICMIEQDVRSYEPTRDLINVSIFVSLVQLPALYMPFSLHDIR